VNKSRHNEEQIAFALKQAEARHADRRGVPQYGISDATFYNWCKKYGGLAPSEM
jgi:putative transposase